MSNKVIPVLSSALLVAAAIAAFLAPRMLEAADVRVAAVGETPTAAQASVERGRYLAKTAGCNDCHTAGYLPAAGKVPESEWLKGDATGWNGPWGTTYSPNLRLFMAKLSEDQWIEYARTVELRPPMPWFGLREMTDADLRSLYRFVRTLGAPGEPAPAYLPPGVKPEGVYVQFVVPAPQATAAR